MHMYDEMGQCCSRQVGTANASQPIPINEPIVIKHKENGEAYSETICSDLQPPYSSSNKSSLVPTSREDTTSREDSPASASRRRRIRNLSASRPIRTKGRLHDTTSPSLQTDESSSDPEQSNSLLRKSFGYSTSFYSKYELGPEVGRGHFGYTCYAFVKSSEVQESSVAVKIIPKAEMKTLSDMEDVRREVKILKSLSGHTNLVQFHDAYEDADRVYIVMELCTGGELLEHILERGGRYAEEDAKMIASQMLSALSFIHLQGVVHRDLKPENFLFKCKDGGFHMKTIDFGLSDFVRPDGKLHDVVGSAYYVAPEVLDQSYSTEADIWSVGVIVYILLSGNRPFWARTESGIFSAISHIEPDFDDNPWPSISAEAKDFVKKLLQKNPRRRLTAAQSLTHPWLCGSQKVTLDVLMLKLVKSYLESSTLRRSALKALAKTLTDDDLYYLRSQFMLLKPEKDGSITLENFKMVLLKSATDAMKESQTWKILKSMSPLASHKMYFREFCAATVNVHQLEMMENWDDIAEKAYQNFDKKGNRLVSVEELAEEMRIPETVPASTFLEEWVRLEDGKLSFRGFTKLLLL